jgi:hypothetical protein
MAKLKVPKSWHKVTPLSKGLALALFIVLPFAGFYFGVEYQKMVTPEACFNYEASLR